MSPKTVILFLALLGVVAASNLRHAKTESGGCIDDEKSFTKACAKKADCPVDFTCPMAAKHGQCGEPGGHVTRICCASCRHEEISDRYQDKHKDIDAAHADIDAEEEALKEARQDLEDELDELDHHHETRMEDFDEEEDKVRHFGLVQVKLSSEVASSLAQKTAYLAAQNIEGIKKFEDAIENIHAGKEALKKNMALHDKKIHEKMDAHEEMRDDIERDHDKLREELDEKRQSLRDEQDAEHAKVAGETAKGPDGANTATSF